MKSKKGLLVAVAIVAAVLLVIGAVALTKKTSTSPSVSSDSAKNVPLIKDTTTETDATDTESTTKNDTKPVKTNPDTLTSVDITPLGATVFYAKGTPGFEFEVLRTVDKTEYVQFTSPDLIGTKCTDDKGAFATILKNPSATESQTTSQTVTVGNDTYGLSLSSAGCTGNVELLTQYQDGFKSGFMNLKAL
ncbi:hypothetical protein H7100_00505 [Candidatus Saccharibacteria bacterium]|nr:hypothetical protein [Candidatus Saccharibacteria bacterium]